MSPSPGSLTKLAGQVVSAIGIPNKVVLVSQIWNLEMRTGGGTAVTKKEQTAAGSGAKSATYHLVGVALAASGAIAFSLRAIFVKLAYEDMSDPVTLLALRMIFS